MLPLDPGSPVSIGQSSEVEKQQFNNLLCHRVWARVAISLAGLNSPGISNLYKWVYTGLHFAIAGSAPHRKPGADPSLMHCITLHQLPTRQRTPDAKMLTSFECS